MNSNTNRETVERMNENESFTCRDQQDADGHVQRAELAHGSRKTASQQPKVRFIRSCVTSSLCRGGEGNVGKTDPACE